MMADDFALYPTPHEPDERVHGLDEKTPRASLELQVTIPLGK